MTLRDAILGACGYLLALVVAFVLSFLMFAFVRPAPTTFRLARSNSPVSRSSSPDLVTTPPRSPASNP